MKSNSFNFTSNIPQRIVNHQLKDRQFVKKIAISKQPRSDSETDVSTTSNENLAPEHATRFANDDNNSLYSNRSSFDESTSSYNTLIVCNPTSDDSLSTNNFYEQKTIVKRAAVSAAAAATMTTSVFRTTKRNSFEFSLHELHKIPNESQILKRLANEACSSSSPPLPPLQPPPHSSPDNLTEIHERKDVKNDDDNDGNDDDDDDDDDDRDSDSTTNRLLRSQPDLCQVVSTNDAAATMKLDMDTATSRNRDIVWQTSDMIDILIKENCALKAEIENCYQKIAKTQFLEREIEKIASSYEDLVQSSERREKLEKTVRYRLHADCKRLQELNNDYKDQIELLSSQLISTKTPIHAFPGSETVKKDLHKREILISQLIIQNKDLMSINEQLEKTSSSLKSQNQEQKKRIEILEATVSSMRSNSNAIVENQCRKKNELVGNVERLKQLIVELELEQKNENGHCVRENRSFDSIPKPQLLRTNDDVLSFLKNECFQLEQNYFDDHHYNGGGGGGVNRNESKSEKITSHESNLNECATERCQSNDDVLNNQFTYKQMTQLQTRIKDLEEKLNERDSLIDALQKHSYERTSESNSSSFQSLLNRNTQRSTRSSICNSTFACSKSLSRDNLVNGGGGGSNDSRSTSSQQLPQSLPQPHLFNQKNYDESKRKLDAQLKALNSKLDSQLVQKKMKSDEQNDRRLCCFPRFTNASSTARRDKNPKQQTAAVTSRPTRHTVNKTNDVELLEQQQQQQQRPRQFSQKLCQFGKKSSNDEKSSLLKHDMMRNSGGESGRSESLPPSALPRPQSKTTNGRNYDPILDRKNSLRLKQPCLQPTQATSATELKKPRDNQIGGGGSGQSHPRTNIRQSFGASRLALLSTGSQPQTLLPSKKLGYFCRVAQQPVAATLHQTPTKLPAAQYRIQF